MTDVKSEHVEFLHPLYFYFIKDAPNFSETTVDDDNQWSIAALLETNGWWEGILRGRINGLPQRRVRQCNPAELTTSLQNRY